MMVHEELDVVLCPGHHALFNIDLLLDLALIFFLIMFQVFLNLEYWRIKAHTDLQLWSVFFLISDPSKMIDAHARFPSEKVQKLVGLGGSYLLLKSHFNIFK